MWRTPLLSVVLVLGAFWTASWPFTVDDAFIAARYAVRLAHGAGYTFADGAVTDGVTGPLWLLPLATASALGVDPVAFAKLFGGMCSVGALGLVIARVRGRTLGRAGAWVSAGIGVSALPLVAWATAGLETGLATLATALLALSVTARPSPSVVGTGMASAALAWLRPELLPLAAALLIGLALRAPRRAAWPAAMMVLGVVALVFFRLAMFGDPLPLSVRAKPPQLGHGLAYLGAVLARPRGLLMVLLIGACLRCARRDVRLLAAALIAHALAIVLAGGDWMPGLRLFAPAVPLLALALGLGIPVRALRGRRTLSAGTIAAVVVGIVELALTLPSLREAGHRRAARLPPIARAVCDASGPVALVDVGALGFACPEQSLIDLGGLTEPAIGQADGGHLRKQVDSAWLRARAPALFVLHSRVRPRVDESGRLRWFAGHPVERRVLALPWVQASYRVQRIHEYAPNYFYVLLAPRERSGGPLSSIGAELCDGQQAHPNVRLAAPADLAP
jgi:hypothetical protein